MVTHVLHRRKRAAKSTTRRKAPRRAGLMSYQGDRVVSMKSRRMRGQTRHCVSAKLGRNDHRPRAKNGGRLAPFRVYGCFISKAAAEKRVGQLRRARQLR